MKKIVIIILIMVCAMFNHAIAQNFFFDEEAIKELYHELNLENDILNFNAFSQAIHGYNLINPEKKNYLCIIDYTKSSKEKRFFIFDIEARELLYHTYVAHGRNSGNEFALEFSNDSGSYKSSLGFFLTEKTYYGRNGYSLVLNGLEKNINDKAKERAIVIHGSNYVTPSYINPTQRQGRSHGCPALAASEAKEIINTIKDGTLIYIYAQDLNYQKKSFMAHNRLSKKSFKM